MILPVYYCNNANFGDSLNIELLKKYIGTDIVFAEIKEAEVIGIGSLLECLLKEEKRSSVMEKPIRVFSTGFGFAENAHPRRQAIQPESLKRRVKCYAVRGRLSLERLKKLTEDSLSDAVVADGGLLAGKLLDETIEKEYRLGIVPHMADKNNELWRELEENIEGSTIIDVTQKPLEVLKELAKCEVVVSSGLHPLIACDSMGIPNAWVKVSDIPSDYKFKDYYSAFNLDKKPYVKDSCVFSEKFLDMIKEKYDVPKEQVESKQEELLHAIALMKKDIEYNGGFIKKTKNDKNIKEAIYRRYFEKKKVQEINFSSTDRILVVSPHPDDESIGCGSLLLKYGKQCDVLLLTDGQKSKPKKEWTKDYVVKLRKREFEMAMEITGVKRKIYAHWNDGHTSEERPSIELKLDEYDYIFIPNLYEKHPDHQYANKAVMKAVKRQKAKATVLEYEVWATLPEPTHYLSVDMDQKSKLIETYQSQLMHINYIERIKGLNYYRGMLFHSEYAECYSEVKSEKLDDKIMQKMYSFYRNQFAK